MQNSFTGCFQVLKELPLQENQNNDTEGRSIQHSQHSIYVQREENNMGLVGSTIHQRGGDHTH